MLGAFLPTHPCAHAPLPNNPYSAKTNTSPTNPSQPIENLAYLRPRRGYSTHTHFSSVTSSASGGAPSTSDTSSSEYEVTACSGVRPSNNSIARDACGPAVPRRSCLYSRRCAPGPCPLPRFGVVVPAPGGTDRAGTLITAYTPTSLRRGAPGAAPSRGERAPSARRPAEASPPGR